MWTLTKWIVSSRKWRILLRFLLKGGQSPLWWHEQSIRDLFEFPFQVNEVYYVARDTPSSIINIHLHVACT